MKSQGGTKREKLARLANQQDVTKKEPEGRDVVYLLTEEVRKLRYAVDLLLKHHGDRHTLTPEERTNLGLE